MQRERIVEALGEFIQDRQGDYAHKDICASVGELGEDALTALEALGLAVVPREPTEGMVEAALHMKTPAYDGAPANYARNLIANTYRAMLAAAPLPAAPNEGEG
jgi:hypothetical protein